MITITLKDKINDKYLSYNIIPYDTPLKDDWLSALEIVLRKQLPIDNDFCHLGFKDSPRNVEFLCNRLGKCKEIINDFPWTEVGLEDYKITDSFMPDDIVKTDPIIPRFKEVNHDVMNKLHNHFERLNGTIENPSPYITAADKWPSYEMYDDIYYLKTVDNLTPCAKAIKDLNLCCHELESLLNSQIHGGSGTTLVQWYQAERYKLKNEHRELFDNGYKRRFGEVYMHWSQVGKTLLEVYNDEGAPELTAAVCEAITHLDYYSAMFDIHWGAECDWAPHEFWEWLELNGYDPKDRSLSLGFMPIAKVDIDSFGIEGDILPVMSQYLHIHSIEYNGIKTIYE